MKLILKSKIDIVTPIAAEKEIRKHLHFNKFEIIFLHMHCAIVFAFVSRQQDIFEYTNKAEKTQSLVC
jgi:hypothetical protein